MKTVVFAIVFASLAGVASAREVTLLSGAGWTADGAAVTVPHTWNAVDGADGDPRGLPAVFGGDSIEVDTYARRKVRYARTLPLAKAGKRYFLRFDGVSAKADVRVNGVRVGTHQGAFTGFTFEITGALDAVGTNRLEVVADNTFDPDLPPVNGDFTIHGGLYRDVWLVETDAVCIDPTVWGGPGVRLVPDAATGEVTAYVSVSGGTNEVQTFRFGKPELWSPENPKLYSVTVKIDQKGCRDEVTETFGFRTVEFRADGFYLNGRKRKIRGMNRHQDWEGKGWALSAEDDEADIRLLKELGADAVRTVHYPQSRRVYSLCDRYGLMAWCEMPCLNAVTVSEVFRTNLRTCQMEMLAQLGNHPSIVMWSVFNEMYHGRVGARRITAYGTAEPFLREVNDRFKALDPSRPTVAATNDPDRRELNDFLDAIAVNTYPGWYGGVPKDRAANLLDNFGESLSKAIGEHMSKMVPRLHRPAIGMSEYGAGGSPFKHANPFERFNSGGRVHTEEYQTWVISEHYRALALDDRYWGTFLWCFADFGADSRREGDRDGINDKGVVTYDRKTKKDSFYFYQANWTKTPVLRIVGARGTEVRGRFADVMVLSNVGDVTLFVNGERRDTRTPDAVKTVLWTRVPLAAGANAVEVRAGGRVATAHWTAVVE